MDIAFCTIDNARYLAEQFSRLDPGAVASLRHSLICDSCQSEAYFRRGSTTGQAACFGARPHNEGCEFGTASAEQIRAQLDDGQDRTNPGDRFNLVLSSAAGLRAQVTDTPGATPWEGTARRHLPSNHTTHAISNMSMNSALRRLVRVKSFQTSEASMILPSGEQWTARKLFVPVGSVSNALVNETRGYWGFIYSAKEDDKGNLWLNTRGRDTPNFRLDVARVSDVMKRFRLASNEDFVGCSILFLGKLREGKKKILFFLDSRSIFVLRHEAQDPWVA